MTRAEGPLRNAQPLRAIAEGESLPSYYHGSTYFPRQQRFPGLARGSGLHSKRDTVTKDQLAERFTVGLNQLPFFAGGCLAQVCITEVDI